LHYDRFPPGVRVDVNRFIKEHKLDH
jgi:hypothetical protein